MAKADSANGPWEVLFTKEAQAWYLGLPEPSAGRIAVSFDALTARGPVTGRPFVGHIVGSRHHHMKEARSIGEHQRALFAFDARRQAIVLVGGDKQGNWKAWYRSNIPRADRQYAEHQRGLGKELMSWRTLAQQRAGGRSAGSGR
jgi:hypothetical protein